MSKIRTTKKRCKKLFRESFFNSPHLIFEKKFLITTQQTVCQYSIIIATTVKQRTKFFTSYAK